MLDNDCTRYKSCLLRRVSKQIIIGIGPVVKQPKLRRLPTKEDALSAARRDIAHLEYEISRQRDRIRRLVEEVEYEALYWQQVIEFGDRRESLLSVKRKVSRLRGAIEYNGVGTFSAHIIKTDSKQLKS